MKRINHFYSIVFSMVLAVFFFTGCPNMHSNKSADNKIILKGTIQLPGALPAKSSKKTDQTIYRSASYSNHNFELKMFAQKEDSDNEFTYPLEIPEYGNMTEYEIQFPNSGLWKISFKCYLNNELILVSQQKSVDIYENLTVLEQPFVLAPLSQTSQQPGSINLPVCKVTNSSVTQLNWKLVNESDPTIIYTGSVTFTDSTGHIQKESVTPGNYIAYFSFVKDTYLYGPIVEYITVLGNLCTDTWYGSDDFIKIDYGFEESKFTVPMDNTLINLFPEYSYTTAPASTDSITILWNQDSYGMEVSAEPPIKTGYALYYTESITSNTYIGDADGLSIADGIDVLDFTIDAKTNDVYFMGKESGGISVTKYSCAKGYAYQNYTFKDKDCSLLCITADNGVSYALVFEDGALILYKGISDDTGLTYTKYSDVLSEIDMDYSFMGFKVKMTLCQNYLFIVYQYYPDSCYCVVVDVSDSAAQIKAVSDDPIGFGYIYDFNLNDIRAVETDGLPDLYVLLGYISTEYHGYQSIGGLNTKVDRNGGVYGGLFRIHLDETGLEKETVTGTSTDALIRGYVSPRFINETDKYYSTTEEDDNKNFYHPLKFAGNSSGKLIIADDGAFYSEIADITPKNRIVTIDIDELTDQTALTQFSSVTPVNVSFDYCYVEGLMSDDPGTFENFKANLYYGGDYYGADVFCDISDDEPLIGFGNDELDITLNVQHIAREGDYKNSLVWMKSNVLPFIKGAKMYFTPTESLSNLTYNVTLYCNGKALENNPHDPYYTVDSEEGSLTLLKPLPVMGYYYNLAIDLIQTIPASDGGEPTVIHKDFFKPVEPSTEFDIRYFTWKDIATVDDLNACLDNFLIADCAVIITDVNNTDGHLQPIPFMEGIRDYFIAHPCANLTLDYSEVHYFDEVVAGLLGIDCSKIIMPVQDVKWTEKNPPYVPTTIKKGAFEYTDVNGKTHYFQGHLVLHKSIQTIENGAFSVPPGSIELNNSGYLATATAINETYVSNFYVTDITCDGEGEYMLIETGHEYKRIYTCTKRDEPFTLDFTPSNSDYEYEWQQNYYNYLVQIDDNAFRGLPVTGDGYTTSVKLGNVKFVGEGAFAETNVQDIDAPNLKLIGMWAFPDFEGYTTLRLSTPEDGKAWYKATMTDPTKWDTQWADALSKANPRFDTDSLDSLITDTENEFTVKRISTNPSLESNILSAINKTETGTDVPDEPYKHFIFLKTIE